MARLLTKVLIIGALQLCAARALSVSGSKASAGVDQARTARRDAVFAPERSANMVSRVTFSWMNRFFKLGNERYLEMGDLWELNKESRAEEAHNRFAPILAEQERRLGVAAGAGNATHNGDGKPRGEVSFFNSPLFRALLIRHRRQIAVSGVLRLLNTAVQFFPPLLLGRLLKTLETASFGAFSATEATKLALALFLTICSKTIIENAYFWVTNRMAAQARSEITAAVLSKSLRLSAAGAASKDGGQAVTTLVQMDAMRIEQVLSQLHVTWDSLVQIAGGIFLLLQLLGPSVASGLSVLLAIVPINLLAYRRLAYHRAEMLKKTDERVRLTSEAVGGMKVLKMQGWEDAASSSVERSRKLELKELRATALLRAGLVAILTAAPSLVSVAILSIYANTGGVLSPSRVFTALSLLNNLRFPLMFYPTVLSALAEGKASLQRMDRFFLAEEAQRYVEPVDPKTSPFVSVSDDAVFCWSGASQNVTESTSVLRNVELEVQKGELVAVAGAVGSGKSSLLAAIAGEMRCAHGSVKVAGPDGSAATSAGDAPSCLSAVVLQRPWVPGGSIRDIILSGREADAPFDAEAYAEAIRGSGLSQDLAGWSAGDLTRVASGGSSLSGGQRARVDLARALYSTASVLLLDDPLSALDADVAAQVWRGGIVRAARESGRAVIISSNDPRLIAQCDKVVLMAKTRDGGAPVCEATFAGTWEGLGAPANVKARIRVLSEKLNMDLNVDGPSGLSTSSGAAASANATVPAPTHAVNGDARAAHAGKAASSAVQNATATALVATGDDSDEEQLERGSVKSAIYFAYVKALGRALPLLLMGVAYVIANSCTVLLNLAISAWTGDSMAGYPSTGPGPQGHRLRVVGCAALLAVSTFVRTALTMGAGLRASTALHRRVLGATMGASMRWHSQQPRGRLLQRFSRDLDAIDQTLPGQLGMLISCVLQIAASLTAISGVTPTFALVAPILAHLYLKAMNAFRAVARELKRIEPASRAPLLTSLGEALAGVRVVRAFGNENAIRSAVHGSISKAASAQLLSKAADRWLSVRLELLGNAVVGIASLLAIASANAVAGTAAGSADLARRAGLSGLSISTAMGITGLLSWTVRTLAETESQMAAVERLVLTADRAPQEEEAARAERVVGSKGSLRCTDEELLASGWPWTGCVEFRNVSFRYAEDGPLILRNVSFTVKPGERIGVVGRTGSGKSTILAALFRLYPIESGQILIDGIPIHDVGLKTLRQGLAIIPQDPYVFEGRSVEDNVDPLRKSDALGGPERIWSALAAAQLATIVRRQPDMLKTVLGNGGAPLSAGQVQLLCLARAFLLVLPQSSDHDKADGYVSPGGSISDVKVGSAESAESAMLLTADATVAVHEARQVAAARAKLAAGADLPKPDARRRILLMDEATSSIDVETEKLISEALDGVTSAAAAAKVSELEEAREKQQTGGDDGKLTVLTIAHRLGTILSSDKVLVLDQGRVMEFGPPEKLLTDQSSRLNALMVASRT